jgi:DNA-binding response OmpR family regulator
MASKFQDLAVSEPKRILIIEDEPSANRYFETALQAEGYETVGVLSGREGLEQLGRQKFDLVLLDIMMQDLDGIETCRLIRQSPQGEKLPVCMITASVDVEKVVTSFKAGANGYIVKPFDLDELLAKILELTAEPAAR